MQDYFQDLKNSLSGSGKNFSSRGYLFGLNSPFGNVPLSGALHTQPMNLITKENIISAKHITTLIKAPIRPNIDKADVVDA